MPLIVAAADRGDPRAQYVLGLSHFNADYAPRDWTRAYALMTLANSAGLPQAGEALAQMDKYIPQAQRAQAQTLAREIESGARSQRQAELAAAELATRPAAPAVAAAPSAKPPVVTAAAAPKPTGLPPASKPLPSAPAPVTLTSAPKGSTVTPVPAALAPRKQGNWRVQLGAFGVASNADKLWSQVGSHAALAGTRKAVVSSGNLTRLLATGFSSEADAGRACNALKREGKACVVAGQG